MGSFNRNIATDPNSLSGNKWHDFGVRVAYTANVQATLSASLAGEYELIVLNNDFTLTGSAICILLFKTDHPCVYHQSNELLEAYEGS